MTKTELIKELSKRAELPLFQASEVIDVLSSILVDTIKEGNALTISGVVTFSPWEQAERIGRNPKTGQPHTISARRSIKLKVSKKLLERINH